MDIDVYGASGFAGAELVNILKCHEHVDNLRILSRSHVGKKFTDLYPGIRFNGKFEWDEKPKGDVVFTATPHGFAAGIAQAVKDNGAKLIDLSADFRFNSQKEYEQVYGKHNSPGLIKEASYGLPELFRKEIKGWLVGNPGCYPTSALLALAPGMKKGLFTGIPIVDSKTGTSGAGANPKSRMDFTYVNDNLIPYGIPFHRHRPEIEHCLERASGTKTKVHFTPMLVPIRKGIISTVHVQLKKGNEAEKLLKAYAEFYGKEQFVIVHENLPDVKQVVGSNSAAINTAVDKNTGIAVITCAIDNMVKGASGQAVQNMNILLKLNESTGLRKSGEAL